MAKTFLLEIVTPEKRFYSGDVEIVIAKTLSGEEGFMAGHIRAFKLLATGELCFREAGGKEYRLAAISGGFIDVSEGVLVYSDSAEWPGEIDVERAEEARLREQEWLEQHKEKPEKISHELAAEIDIHKQAVKRAINRKKVAAGENRQRH